MDASHFSVIQFCRWGQADVDDGVGAVTIAAASASASAAAAADDDIDVRGY